jgi:hypothetical protein
MTEHKFKMQNAKLKRPENGKMEKGKVDIYDRVFEFGCRIVRCINVRREHQRRDRSYCKSYAPGRRSARISRKRTRVKAGLISSRKARIALKEARETLYWLRLIGATAIVSMKRLEPLIQESREIVAILTMIVKNTTAARSR